MEGDAVLEAAEEGLALGVGRLLEDRARGKLDGAVDDRVGCEDGEGLLLFFVVEINGGFFVHVFVFERFAFFVLCCVMLLSR